MTPPPPALKPLKLKTVLHLELIAWKMPFKKKGGKDSLLIVRRKNDEAVQSGPSIPLFHVADSCGKQWEIKKKTSLFFFFFLTFKVFLSSVLYKHHDHPTWNVPFNQLFFGQDQPCKANHFSASLHFATQHNTLFLTICFSYMPHIHRRCIITCDWA